MKNIIFEHLTEDIIFTVGVRNQTLAINIDSFEGARKLFENVG